jgi:hypothetical protein
VPTRKSTPSFRIRVPRQELDLAAEDAALGVQLVHVHLGTLERGLAEQRARSGEDDGEADLDRLLGLGGERRRQGQSEQHGQKAQQHRHLLWCWL